LTILVGVILLGAATLVSYAYLNSEFRLTKQYQKKNDVVAISADSDVISRGKHIFQFRGCESCHGENLEGKVYLSDPAIGEVITTNLTRGQGGLGNHYMDADWVNAIRYGIRNDSTPLLFMPSTEFYYLSDEDLGAVISYIKSMPGVNHVQKSSQLSLIGRILMTYVKDITFIPTELVPTDARPVAPLEGVSVEYGEYLSYSCKVCHGLGMSGGKIPGFPSDWPIAPNLTMGEGSHLPILGEEGFTKVLRTGVTFDGHLISPVHMPWTSYKFMSDDELSAVWLYLQSLTPTKLGSR
jgi:mono/diheme cytochrome c family protein